MNAPMPDLWTSYIDRIGASVDDAGRDHDGWPAPSSEFDSSYVYFYSTIKIALSKDDLVDIWQRISQYSDVNRHLADFLRSVIDSRIANFGKWKNIISLGTDCLPRTIATRWGLKRPRALGESSHPFDLNITPIGSLPSILQTNFDEYFESLSYPIDLGFPVHEGYGIWFNHEYGPQWAANEFADLRRRYERRISSFRAALQDDSPSTFVLHISSYLDDAHFAFVKDAFAAIKYMSLKRINMVCIASNGSSVKSDNSELIIAEVDRPYPEYDWSQHQHYTTSGGLKFETAIAQAIIDGAKRLEAA